MDLNQYSQQAILIDGSPVLIRAIRPDDKQRLQEGFQHLSHQSIFQRCFTGKRNLTGNESKFLTEVDFNHHVSIIAWLGNEDKKVDIAVARYVEIKGRGSERVADIAFTVDDEYQGLGVGTVLLQHYCNKIQV